MRRVKPYGHLDRLTICTTQATMRESINQWSPEWDDDTAPRTERPVRFHHGKRYVRSYFGTLEDVVPYSRIA